MMSIPSEIKDFSAAWLNQVLPIEHPELPRVAECTALASPTPGQTAEIVFLDVTWEVQQSALPNRLIAKYTSQNPQVIEEVVNVFDQYRRETSFYRDFTDPGIRIPTCYYQAFDGSSQRFVLLLEDLSPAESPSWAITIEQVTLALAQLPAFHAKWWNQPALRQKSYCVQFDDHDFFQLGLGAASEISAALSEHFDDVKLTQTLMPLVARKRPELQAVFATRPYTLVHGDYHAKQLFFESEHGGGFAAIDWQFPFVAQGPWDFARLMVLGLPTDDRRRLETRLLENYMSGLVRAGVTDYSRVDLETDLRFGLVISHMINVIAIGSTDISLVAKECSDLGVDWQDVMFYRGQAALDDWQVLPFVESLSI